MNGKQRMQNRANAEDLRQFLRQQHVCEGCGEKGLHWVSVPGSFYPPARGGFWTCRKFYDASGRRIGGGAAL